MMQRLFQYLVVFALLGTPAIAVTFTFDPGTVAAPREAKFTQLPDFGPINESFIIDGASQSHAKNVATYTGVATGLQPLQISGTFGYQDPSDVTGYGKFGYLRGGVQTELGSPPDEFGSFSFLVDPGQSFGWYLANQPFFQPIGRVVVNASIAPVPLPAALPMLIAAIGGLMFVRVRRFS